jgi:hypothetical protein
LIFHGATVGDANQHIEDKLLQVGRERNGENF